MPESHACARGCLRRPVADEDRDPGRCRRGRTCPTRPDPWRVARIAALSQGRTFPVRVTARIRRALPRPSLMPTLLTAILAFAWFPSESSPSRRTRATEDESQIDEHRCNGRRTGAEGRQTPATSRTIPRRAEQDESAANDDESAQQENDAGDQQDQIPAQAGSGRIDRERRRIGAESIPSDARPAGRFRPGRADESAANDDEQVERRWKR